ncbi:MAG TPA: hypothetical protein DCX54_04825, partial [Flavobacteriales bacterium]|nr:hypothetical protein [Flavobacteriales bacterium]
TDPLIDGFVSTDSMDIIHHGCTHKRVEKTDQIADWNIAKELLWVCTEHRFKENSWNCSRCEKCMRTMIPLYALGKLENFKTFEKPLRKNAEVLWWARKFSLRHDFVTEIFPFVKRHKPDLIPWLYLAVMIGHIRYRIVMFMPGFMKKWLRRYGYYVTRDEAADAYEYPQVTRIIKNFKR